MSLAVNPIKTVRIVDPLVNFGGPDFQKEYSVISGGQSITYRPYTTNTFSNSSISFTTPPPNPGTSTDMEIYIQYNVKLVFNAITNNLQSPDHTANINSRYALNNDCDAFRAFPLSNCTTTLQCTIGNGSASINLSDVVSCLSRTGTPKNILDSVYSSCPSFLDTAQTYNTSNGTSASPLGAFGTNGLMNPRGAFQYTSVNNVQLTLAQGAGDNTYYTIPADGNPPYIEATIIEPIMLSPFAFGKGAYNKNGLIGIQSMSWIFTLGDLSRMWSHDAYSSGINLTLNSSLSSISNPILLFKYVTPKLLAPLPYNMVYAYDVVDRFPTQIGKVAANTGGRIASTNIQLQTIPKIMYIYARRSNIGTNPSPTPAYPYQKLPDYSADINSTDTFLSIKNININYNNMAGLLSSATTADLYHMSRRNGVNLSWTEWAGDNYVGSSYLLGDKNAGTLVPTKTPQVGSIVAVAFGIDIGLDDLHAPGEIFNSQLQITVDYYNNSDYDIDATLYIVPIYEGTWTVSNLQSIPQIGVLSKQDILDSQQKPGFDYSGINIKYGGDILSSVKKFGKSAVNAAKSAAPYIKKGAEAVSKGVDAAESIGALAGLGYSGGANSGGARHRRGAALVSRAELHNRY